MTDTDDRWDAYWATVGDETHLLVRDLLECSFALRLEVESWISVEVKRTIPYDGNEPTLIVEREATLDWTGWLNDVETEGRGWSSTEHRLYALVRGLLWGYYHPEDAETYDHERGRYVLEFPRVDLADVLGGLGSWEEPVLKALVAWASGGRLVVHAQ